MLFITIVRMHWSIKRIINAGIEAEVDVFGHAYTLISPSNRHKTCGQKPMHGNVIIKNSKTTTAIW